MPAMAIIADALADDHGLKNAGENALTSVPVVGGL
jgi:hypothetical protein